MALKRVTSLTEVRHLGHIRLWIDDLIEIYRIVKQASDGPIYMRVDDDYAIDGVEDLTDFESARVKSLILRAGDGAIQLVLSKNEASLTLDNPSLAFKGMATEIERIALKRKRRIFAHRHGLLAFGTAVFMLAFTLVVYLAYDERPAGQEIGAISAAGITGALVGIGLFRVLSLITLPKGGAIIVPRFRKDAPTWLQRNKDGLTTNAIVSLVFLVIGFIVGKLTS